MTLNQLNISKENDEIKRKLLKKEMNNELKVIMKEWKLNNQNRNFVEFISDQFPENFNEDSGGRCWVDARILNWKKTFDKIK